MVKKVAMISGITGQDGSYLAEYLLWKGWKVVGLVRRNSIMAKERIDHLQIKYKDRLVTEYWDLSEADHVDFVISKYRPEIFFHMAAQSHVGVSFELPVYTSEVTGVGTARILNAIVRQSPDTRFYNASTSELFGATKPPQSIDCLFVPNSPYAAAKLYSFNMTRIYREAYGLYAVNGILFNHESPRRTENFVTRKIIKNLSEFNKVTLGNLKARRDWGFSPEYMEIIAQVMQMDTEPEDFILGTGISASVEEFFNYCCEYLDFSPSLFLKTSMEYERPLEVDHLEADLTGGLLERLDMCPKLVWKDVAKIMIDAESRFNDGYDYENGEGVKIMKKRFPWISWGVKP